MKIDDETKIENLQSSYAGKKKNILIQVLKKHKISLLLVLLLCLVSGTLCWFIYNKTTDVLVQGRVKAWQFEIKNESFGVVDFDLEELYPGIGEKKKVIKITNKGEIAGEINLLVESITLFGEQQILGDDYGIEYASDGSINITKYPFSLNIKLGKDVLDVGDDSTTIEFTFDWDYDNDSPDCIEIRDGEEYNKCDEEDTLLGSEAYNFISDPINAGKPSLLIKLRISITQERDS